MLTAMHYTVVTILTARDEEHIGSSFFRATPLFTF